LATNGIDKPVLNVFRMFGMMSGDRVKTSSSCAVPLNTLVETGVRQGPDVDALATLGTREAAVLVWNYHDVNQPAPAAPTSLTIRGIPAGVDRVLLEHYRIDDTHSNAYTAWQKIGSPQHPTTQQYAALRSAGQLQLLTSPEWLDVANGEVTIKTEMPRQGISLLRLKW
jgi:xylan 1,4-beta-xylosidase